MDDQDAIKAHLAYLRLAGQSAGSVYARERALARLAAWLRCYGEDSRPGIGAQRDAATEDRGLLPYEGNNTGPGLLDATAADLAAWRAALQVEPNTVRTYVAHARGFYRFAVTQGLIDTNPAAGLPVPRRVRGIPRPCSEDELMAAVQAAPPRIRPWLVLAGWAGLRAMEIAGLRRECVLDALPAPLILVAAESTKGGRHERIVPMSPFVLAELRAYGLPRSGFVFERYDGKPGPNAAGMVSHLANEALAAAGADCTLHQLRHRFASQLYMETRDLRLVQEMLGHTDPATTAAYAAYDQTSAGRAVAALRTPGLRLVKESALRAVGA